MKLISIFRTQNHGQEPSSLLTPTIEKPHQPFFNIFRRVLRPCFCTTTSTAITNSSSTTITKKRNSTSLNPNPEQEDAENEKSQETQEDEENQEIKPWEQNPATVIGTIFGHRRGRVCICIQQDRLSSNPLLLELTMPTYLLAKEMQTGYLRIALKSNKKENSSSSSLLSVPVWTMYCNGRKVGFAFKRKVTEKVRRVLKTMQSTSAGAGVIPAGSMSEEGELMYMRASYERVVGSCDSEAYHLINPHGSPGQELSIFLIRSA